MKIASKIDFKEFGFSRTDLVLYIAGIAEPLNLRNRESIIRSLFSFFKINRYLEPLLDHSFLNADLSLTNKGFKRLSAELPRYKARDHWGGELYLVLFDIPESLKVKRELLRRYLKKHHCGLLQNSIWISFENIEAEIRDYATILKLDQQCILVLTVSSWQQLSPDLIQKIWNIDLLEQKYQEFITKYSTPTDLTHIMQAHAAYIHLLRSDPQVPPVLFRRHDLKQSAHALYERLVRALFTNTHH